MSKRAQAGLTLIEMMTVIAIAGIVAAIAIPAWLDHASREKFSAALAEITPGKMGVDDALKGNKTPVLTAVTSNSELFVGVQEVNANSTVTLTGGAAARLVARIVGGAKSVEGQTITLTRDQASGKWACTTTVEQKYVGAVETCVGA